jgi:hypothetical protein
VAGDADEADSAAVILLCDRLSGIKCINMNSRRDKWEQVQQQAHRIGRLFAQKLERLEAEDGEKMLRSMQRGTGAAAASEVVQIEWDATKNAQYSRWGAPLRTCRCGGAL